MPKKTQKTVNHIQMTEGKRNIIQHLLTEYNIETYQNIQDTLKEADWRNHQGDDGSADMDNHIGYKKYQRPNSTDSLMGIRGKS